VKTCIATQKRRNGKKKRKKKRKRRSGEVTAKRRGKVRKSKINRFASFLFHSFFPSL